MRSEVDNAVDMVLLKTAIKQPLLLHYACDRGDIETVKRLIELGLDINKEGVCKRTPLHYAIESSQKEVVRLLLEKGADINKKDGWGKDAISCAEYHQCLPCGKDIVKILKNN